MTVESAVTLLGNASCHIEEDKDTQIRTLWLGHKTAKRNFSSCPITIWARIPQGYHWNRCQLSEKPGMPLYSCLFFFGEASHLGHQEGSTSRSTCQCHTICWWNGSKQLLRGPSTERETIREPRTNNYKYANSIIKLCCWRQGVCSSTKVKGPFRGGRKTGFLLVLNTFLREPHRPQEGGILPCPP